MIPNKLNFQSPVQRVTGLLKIVLPSIAALGLLLATPATAAGDAEDGGPGTDFHAVMQGYVSITPLQLDRTFHEAFGGLDEWLGGLT